jgi:hypothetical protein
MNLFRQLLLALIAVLVLGQPLLAQEGKNMSLVGNYGRGEGESKAVFAYGSLVYYGLGNKIQIASFSNPASPVKVSSVILTDVVEGVVRTSINSTAYLVVTGGSKMWIINVQSPTSPSLTATVDVAPGTTCEGVATSGSYAYVAAGGSGLKIYSISNPSAPSLVASIDSLAYCENVVISAPYAYVAADNSSGYTGRSYIIDVSNPAAPIYKSTIYGFGGYHQYMAVRGAYAYICDYNAGLQVINVASPTAPVNVTTVPSGSRTAGIVFDGNYAYVAVGDSGMKIYNVANLAAPSLVSYIMTTGRAAFVSYGAVSIGGVPTGHIFISDRNPAPGLSAVNISNPASPTTAAFLAALPAPSGNAFSSFYTAGKVYVAYGSAGLRILDVSSPAQPVLLSTLPLPGESRGIVVKGTTAYVAAMDSGVHVVDVTTPASPSKLTTIATSRARGITLNGNQVYVATRDSGLVILDVTTPASPVWLSSVRGLDVENVAANGNVVGTSFYSSIRFYDVTDPANPVAKGSTPNFRVGNEGFAIAGSYAYVPDGDSMKIFNISDLMAPTLTSKIKTGGYGFAAAKVGDYCYVASDATGVRAINVSNPVVPVEDGYYDGVPQSRGLSASGEYVYVAEKLDGLSVYRNNLLTSVEDYGAGVPRVFALAQNYPNPFNPSTTIGVELARSGFVTLEVFNVLGQRVATLLNREMAAGTYDVKFNAASLPSGMYAYRLQSQGFSSVRTMMLLK